VGGYKQAQPESIRNLELSEDGSEVSLDGSLGDFQPVGHFFIVRSVSYPYGNLLLAGGQIVNMHFRLLRGIFLSAFAKGSELG
jgi:hypothetical protein